MTDAVILSAVRLPTGRFQGALSPFTAPQLGALVVREAVQRAGLEAGTVDECILGNVVSAGLGQAPARQAALRAGLADAVAALTINKVCGSGLKAVMLAAQGVATGDIEVAVAGGMESMTNAPYLLDRARSGYRLGHARAVDSVVHDGLWCAFEDWHMGRAAEVVAAEYGVSRDAQDAFAARQPPQGGARGRGRPLRRGDPARRDHGTQRDHDHVLARRSRARRHVRGRVGRAEAGLRHRWHGHRDGRQRAAAERRRVGARRGLRTARREPRRDAAGADRRPGDERPGSQARADDAGGRRAARGGESGLAARHAWISSRSTKRSRRRWWRCWANCSWIRRA